MTQSMPLSHVLTVALLRIAVAKWDAADKAKDVQVFVVNKYKSAGCSDTPSEEPELEFKEVGTCWPANRLEAGGRRYFTQIYAYRKAFVNETHWVEQEFSDAACTNMTNSASDVIAKRCTESGSGGSRTGALDLTKGTFYWEHYTAEDCEASSLEYGAYHAGDACTKSENLGIQDYSYMFATDSRELKFLFWLSNDCTGPSTTQPGYPMLGNGFCTAYPASHKSFGKWYKLWVWRALEYEPLTSHVGPVAQPYVGLSSALLMIITRVAMW